VNTPCPFHRAFATCLLALACVALLLPSSFARAADGWQEFETCAQIREGFRAFHGHAFPSDRWTCDDGVLHSIKDRRVDLVTCDDYDDFELELEWKVAWGANSGIMYGVSEAGSETYWSGPEMQINDDPHHSDGLEPKTSAGGLYDLIAPARRDALKPTGEYNHVRIVSRGGHVEHWLNGVLVVAYDWGSPELRALIAKTKFATAPLFMQSRRGHIALQSEGDEVWFRHIRVRRLAPADAGATAPFTLPDHVRP